MKLLLFTDIPPCKTYTGGLVLDQLCRFVPKGALACFTMLHRDVAAERDPELDWMPIAYTRKRREMRVNGQYHFWGRVEAWLGEELYRRLIVPRLIKQAVAFARAQKVDAIWAVLEGQTTIQMAPLLAKKLKLPLYTMVWDPLSWWLGANYIDPAHGRVAQRDFDRAIAMSKGVMAASRPMAARYREAFGVKAVPVISSHPRSLAKPAAGALPPDTLTLGMAGQFYAEREWIMLMEALDELDWKLGARDLKMVIMGRNPPPGDISGKPVEFLGWKTQPEAAEILSRCDVLICPYPFDLHMREVAEISFPSKVCLYLAAGRPVLFVGPEYASPVSYIRERDAGLPVTVFTKAAIVNALMRFTSEPGLYERQSKNAVEAFLEDFTLESMRASFAETLGVGVEGEFASLHPTQEQAAMPGISEWLPNVVEHDFSFWGLKKEAAHIRQGITRRVFRCPPCVFCYLLRCGPHNARRMIGFSLWKLGVIRKLSPGERLRWALRLPASSLPLVRKGMTHMRKRNFCS